MAWVVEIRRKIENLCLEAEGVMREDGFDFIEHQLQTVGASVENQFQTVSANIENQLQAVGANIENQMQTIGANIKQLCSVFVQDKLPKHSLNFSHEEDSKLSDTEDKKVDITALESSVLHFGCDPKKGLQPNFRKFTDSKTSKAGLSSDDSSAISNNTSATFETASEIGSSCAESELKVVARLEYNVSAVDFGTEDSDDDMDMDAEKSTDGQVIEPNMEVIQFEEPKLDESFGLVDSNEQCSVCLKLSKSHPVKKGTCGACTAKMKLTEELECEQQSPVSEDLNAELSRSESKSSVPHTGELETADYDFCESDWEII